MFLEVRTASLLKTIKNVPACTKLKPSGMTDNDKVGNEISEKLFTPNAGSYLMTRRKLFYT